jgi:ADP-ribose pyrophosphatase
MQRTSEQRVVGVEVLSDDVVGTGGFLAVRRLRMRNVRDDGSRSAEYLVDFIVRPKGVDAVAVALWHRRADGAVLVLMRDGLRPPLHVGRPPDALVVPDRRKYLFFREVVAGIVERDDRGEAGLKRRAAIEVEEESGYTVRAEDVVILGAGTFPTPGAMAERFFLAAAEVADIGAGQAPEGDGSPMEEGADQEWLPLDDAIAACVRGDIEDAKSELALRRLADWLAGRLEAG